MSNNIQIPGVIANELPIIETIDEGGGVSRQVIVLGSIGDASGETQLSAGQKTSANSIPVVVASDQTAVPVTGTFWQTTQPVSGTVTANAGTNMSTAALALESGGNLATVATAQGASGTGITQPTGGSGILGWLSGIYKAITGTLTVSGTVGVSGTVPVSGTFWQTTQPVSGTVTANAGTNMSTAALALESGGNLATLAGTVSASKVAVSGTFWQTTQPVSAASLPLPSNAAQETGGNLATIAGTVSASKVQVAVASALPAGSNAIGSVYAAPTSSSSFAITPGASSALETGHVLKASAGNLYSLYIYSSSANGYLMTFNATSIPADGTVAPVEFLPVYAGSSATIDFSGSPPDYYSTGIVAVFSTTGPYTKTGSATAFFKWRVQ